VLADWRTAPVDGPLKQALGFLEKVTLRPREVVAADARALLDAGLTRDHVRDALYVCFLFNVYDRMADSLKFRLSTPEGYEKGARTLLTRGYK
jgi:alkylhydroperoxidase family enzyme